MTNSRTTNCEGASGRDGKDRPSPFVPRLFVIRTSPAFTLLEILLAVALLSVVATITFMTFSVVVHAWRRGSELSRDLEHGDYVADQLVMAMRSAYYPDAKAAGELYGFWHEDNGDGAGAEDRISWVKLGHALVGDLCPFAESPHRVEFFLDEDENGTRAAMVKAWRLHGQAEEFDPETDVEAVPLSNRVVGFNCRAAFEKDEDEGIDWLDEWEETNRIPTMVELAVYLVPLDPDEDPVEVKRVFDVPTAVLSWKGFNANAGARPGTESGGRRSEVGDGTTEGRRRRPAAGGGTPAGGGTREVPAPVGSGK